MNSLPSGWITVKLKDTVDKIVGGGTPSKSIPSYYEGDIPWMTVKDMNKSYLTDTMDHITQKAIDNSSTNVIPAGIPIIATRMSLGKIVRASFDSAINQDLKALFVSKEMDQFFFEYWYRSQAPKIQSLGTGTTVKGVRLEVLNNLTFPLAPLPEQKRIVEKLDEVLAQVDSIKARLDSIPDILKRFRQSVLAAAVSGKLTEGLSDTDWEQYILSDLAKFQNGYAFKSGWFEKTGKHQVIKLGNVKDNFLNLDASPAYLSDNLADDHKQFKPEIGDILLSMTGTKFKRDYGFACIIEEDLPILINQRVGRIIANRKLVKPEFLHLFIRSEQFRNQFFAGETGGVNQGNVGSKHVMSCKLSIPSLISQEEIASKTKIYFTFADTIEEQVKKAQAKVDNLTQSILAKAFRGELVPQNPEDESAAELLKRIKIAKEEAEKLAKAAKAAEKAKKNTK